MKNIVAVLFEDKIFSKNPNYYPFSFFSNLETNTNLQKEGNVYFEIDPFWNSGGRKILIYDPVETYFRNERIKNFKNIKLNLEFARKIIIDDYHYPAFSSDFIYDEYDDDYGGTTHYPRFGFYGGRSELLDMIRLHHYSEAITEVREVALYDTDITLRSKAISTFGSLKRNIADVIVNEVLEKTNNKYIIFEVCDYIKRYSLNNLFISNLRKKFEEYYHDFDNNYLSLKWCETIPQRILNTCASIISLESLKILEEGIKHPYKYIEDNARFFVLMWMERIYKDEIKDEILIKKVIEISNKYDIHNYDKYCKILETKKIGIMSALLPKTTVIY